MMHARCACSRTPGPCMNLCASVSLFQDPFHGFGNAHLLAPNTLLLVCEEPNSSITRNALRRCPRMARANIHQKAPSFLTKLRYALVYAKAYLCRGNAAPFLLNQHENVYVITKSLHMRKRDVHSPCSTGRTDELFCHGCGLGGFPLSQVALGRHFCRHPRRRHLRPAL